MYTQIVRLYIYIHTIYTGAIPAVALGQLTELTFLSMAHNKLTGVCDDNRYSYFSTVLHTVQNIVHS
jgi:hypothetical protein